jgi:hypothetical protein
VTVKKSPTHLVVDGSNIATEGRQMPSLTQLEEAVDAFVSSYHFDNVIVVVDATFGHRITPKERRWFDELVATNKIITPPAGAIGRGDAFILQIATRANATVLSNDSFQEFHGTHLWLFDEGRLFGGKPVPYVGWVFVSRAPVRGPASRRAVKKASSPRATAGAPREASAERAPRRASAQADAVAREEAAIIATTSDVEALVDASTLEHAAVDTTIDHVDAAADGDESRRPKRRSRRGRKVAPEAPPAVDETTDDKFNETLAFQGFRDTHPLGEVIEVVVDRFSSHGAYAKAADVEVYIPTKALGDPPPSRARDVLTLGELTLVAVDRYDDASCGIDVRAIRNEERDAYYASPRASSSAVMPSSDVDADAATGRTSIEGSEQPTRRSEPVATKKVAAKKATAKKAPAKKAPAKKAAAKKAPAKAVAKKAPAKKAVAKKAPAKKAPAKKAVAKKAPAKKAVAKKAPAKKAVAKKAPAKKAAAKKAPAKKAAARK